jgi:hypothetical protein
MPRPRPSSPLRSSSSRSASPARGLRRLQREQAALGDARTALERERVAREAAEKSLEERNAAFSKVEDEALALSISNANQELALREQGETVQRLELAIESARRDFDLERKQVEGEPLFDSACWFLF